MCDIILFADKKREREQAEAKRFMAETLEPSLYHLLWDEALSERSTVELLATIKVLNGQWSHRHA